MENKPKWRKLKIKPRKVNNVQQHHEDYFLVQSVYMDVLIKKQFYDDVNKKKSRETYYAYISFGLLQMFHPLNAHLPI